MGKIAILGATGHIAKGLIFNFCKDSAFELFMFARSAERTAAFLKEIRCDRRDIHIAGFQKLAENRYTVIINCVGLGTPQKVKEHGREIFAITEHFDDLVTRYLDKYPETLYVNMSSGAVYGKEFSKPVDEDSVNKLQVNAVDPKDFYAVAKINSEAKHRSLPQYHIVDLRVFGYFSRFIDLNAGYLLTEIITCVKNGTEFVTGPNDIVRDYVHPDDLFSLIQRCLQLHSINDAFDVRSSKPATKFEILDYFKEEYGLRYSVRNDFDVMNMTGNKDCYYSKSRKIEKLGYSPHYSSLDCISGEMKYIL